MFLSNNPSSGDKNLLNLPCLSQELIGTDIKGVHVLRGKFGPLWSQKLKVAFHQFHPIGLLEEWFHV